MGVARLEIKSLAKLIEMRQDLLKGGRDLDETEEDFVSLLRFRRLGLVQTVGGGLHVSAQHRRLGLHQLLVVVVAFATFALFRRWGSEFFGRWLRLDGCKE